MFLSPIKPPYDPLEWAAKPFAEKSRLVCAAWAMQGYGAPVIGAARRGVIDVTLYASTCAVLVAALVSARPSMGLLLAVVTLVPALGILDKTLFLAARGEHYWTTTMVFVLASNFVPGAKVVQASLWFWAGFSKLNHHFPAVVCVMTSNSPVMRLQPFRRPI